jgi:predicted ferric reductase
VLCFPAHDTVQTSIYYETRQIELAKYISNRLGTLAVANIPLVWFFAIRNSPLLWLTGWSYSTFSQFHRWTARLTALLVVSHGISYSITNTYKKTYFSVWDKHYWQCGVVVSGLNIHMGRIHWLTIDSLS